MAPDTRGYNLSSHPKDMAAYDVGLLATDIRANERVSAANGVDYAYRDTGGGHEDGVPLILLQHFRGNLDNWDPALIDALAVTRRVITFDNAGVGGSGGTTPTPSIRWPATPSRLSPPCSSARWTCWAFPSAAS